MVQEADRHALDARQPRVHVRVVRDVGRHRRRIEAVLHDADVALVARVVEMDRDAELGMSGMHLPAHPVPVRETQRALVDDVDQMLVCDGLV